MKLWRNKKVVADRFEIISCQEHSGERINWRKEDRIRYEAQNNSNGFSFFSNQAEFENRLDLACGPLETVKRDPWTNEKHIYSFQIWYTYKLKVSYTYGGRSYETTVNYETEMIRLDEDRRLDVTFDKSEPQRVLYVSVHPESIWEYLYPL